MTKPLKESTEEKQPLARLNVDIPKSLHQRIKVGCALEDRDIKEVVLELLEQRFPDGKHE